MQSLAAAKEARGAREKIEYFILRLKRCMIEVDMLICLCKAGV